MSPIYINNKKIESIYINNQSIGKVYVGDVLVFQKNNYTGDSFKFTIDTTLGTGSSFDLPFRSGYNYDFVVDWGDGNTNTITSYNQTEKLHTYSTGGIYTITITGLCETWYFNYGGDRLKLISIEQWGNTGFVNMGYAFYGCSNLTTVNDTNGTWCSSVTNMNGMFYGCSSLTTLDVSNWNVSNVVSMGAMFTNTPLDTASYDALLIGWSQLPSLKSNVRLGANLSKYSAGAAADARQYIINTYGWTIIDAGQVV